MINPRKWAWPTGLAHDNAERVGVSLMSGFGGFVGSFFVSVFPSYIFYGGDWGLACTLIAIGGAVIPPAAVNAIVATHPLKGVYDDELTRVGQKFLALDEKDQREFGRNYLESLAKVQGGTEDHQYDFILESKKLFGALEDRAKAVDHAKRLGVDVSGHIEYIRDAREGVKIETRTYKELC